MTPLGALAMLAAGACGHPDRAARPPPPPLGPMSPQPQFSPPPMQAESCGPLCDDLRDRHAVVHGALAAGYDHTCVVTSDARVHCWGSNVFGQLGVATPSSSKRAVIVPELTGVREVAAAGYQTCALRSEGEVWCWGSASAATSGMAGAKISPPLRVSSPVKLGRVAVAPTFACALQEGGKVACWGDNRFGVLGNGTILSSAAPVEVVGVTDALDLAVGEHHACVLYGRWPSSPKASDQPRHVKCWGYNFWGKVGDNGPSAYSSVPRHVASLFVDTLVHGRYCAFAGASGSYWHSWGEDDYGNRGMLRPQPLEDNPMGAPAADGAFTLSAGATHACGIFSRGEVRCWGHNAGGQLGDGTTTDTLKPVRVHGIAGARAVAAGPGHTCALLAGDAVSCWGHDNFIPMDSRYSGTFDSSVPIGIEGLSAP